MSPIGQGATVGHRLQLLAVARADQGDYECVAENGVPGNGIDPPSDRIHLTVNCEYTFYNTIKNFDTCLNCYQES